MEITGDTLEFMIWIKVSAPSGKRPTFTAPEVEISFKKILKALHSMEKRTRTTHTIYLCIQRLKDAYQANWCFNSLTSRKN